jgi:hypothetical protein
VQFGLATGQLYSGYQSFLVPSTILPSSVTTITLLANVLAPVSTSDEWDWSIYNWTTASYEKLGTQNHCGGPTGRFVCTDDSSSFLDWRWNQYNALGTKSSYINASTREIRIQLASTNGTSHINVDWAAVKVYSNSGTSTIWQPPANYRWQYQLQASAANGTSFPTTQGIDVNVCQVPFTGGACVQPNVIDFDFNEDAQISGSNNYIYTAGAVAALHASGRKAIGYMTAGDAENWRADFQQMVDFDTACSGCYIGTSFSHTFANEFYVDINNNQGQADFHRKMVQGRTDRIASIGFDAVEYDVVNAYENKSGFSITYATQVAYNESLAAIAHSDGLSAPLKSDVDQATDAGLQAAFNFVIDEQCWQYSQCSNYSAWQTAGKAIFNVEYEIAPSKFCASANSINFNSIKKAKDYSLYDIPWEACR